MRSGHYHYAIMTTLNTSIFVSEILRTLSMLIDDGQFKQLRCFKFEGHLVKNKENLP